MSTTRELEKIASILGIIILSVIFFTIEKGISDFVIILSLFIFYIYFFRSILKSTTIVRGIKTYLSINFFFLLFMYIVFYNPYQLYLLGLYDINAIELPFNLHLNMTNKSLILTDIALVSFMLGFNTKYYDKSAIEGIKVNINLLNNLSFFFVVILIISISIFLGTGGVNMFIGSYAGSNTGSITGNAIFNVINIFFTLLAVNIIYIFYLFKKVSFINRILLFLILVWSILLLVLGDRNTFFLLAIAIGGAFFTFIKSISRIKICLFVFLGLSLYNVIERTRNLESLTLDEVSRVLNKEKEKNAYGADAFNTTLVTLRSSIDLVPEKKDFYYGKLKFVSFTSIIPYSSRIFISNDDKEYSSADIISEYMIGRDAGWHTGTNIISDLYLDFGVFGVIIGMLIIGFYGGYVKNTILKNPFNIKYFFIYIIILCYYSEISRYGFDFPLRSIFWTLFIFKIIQFNQLKKS